MQEMLEVTCRIGLLLGLFCIAWFDYETKMIDTKWLWGLGLVGMLCALAKGEVASVVGVFLGMLVGFGTLFLAWVSGESIGYGDGWLFVVTGIFLGFLENFVLLFGSMVLAGVFAVVCLVLKKKGRNDRVALAPFVLAAYVVFVL